MVQNVKAKLLTRLVEYKDGKSWKMKTVQMHVNDIQDGLRLLEMSLTNQHGARGWRFKKT